MTYLSGLLTEEYTMMASGGRSVYPILQIDMTINGKTVPLRAQLDTGSDGGVALTIDEVIALAIDLGSPIDPNPHLAKLANNTVIKEYDYAIEVKFTGLNKPIPSILSVMGDVPSFIPMSGREEREAASKVVAILGREIMDRYIVTFNGKAHPQKQFTFAD